MNIVGVLRTSNISRALNAASAAIVLTLALFAATSAFAWLIKREASVISGLIERRAKVDALEERLLAEQAALRSRLSSINATADEIELLFDPVLAHETFVQQRDAFLDSVVRHNISASTPDAPVQISINNQLSAYSTAVKVSGDANGVLSALASARLEGLHTDSFVLTASGDSDVPSVLTATIQVQKIAAAAPRAQNEDR